jgi:hypothetical protein
MAAMDGRIAADFESFRERCQSAARKVALASSRPVYSGFPGNQIRQQDADATFDGEAGDIRTGPGSTRLRSRVPGAGDITRKLLDT